MLSYHTSVELKTRNSHRYSDTAARFTDSHRHTWNDDTRNRQKAGTPHRCLETQGFHHSEDEIPMSYGPTGAQHPSGSPHDDKDRSLTSLRARTLPPIPIPVSQDVLQRVLAAPNDPLRPSPPSFKQPDPRSSHPIGVQNLLNPVEGDDHANAGSTSSSLCLSEKTTGLPGSAKSYVPALPMTRSSPRRQLSQEAPYSQEQDCECLGGVNPAPPQQASQSDSPGTQYSSYSQVSRIEPTIAPPIVSAGQTQLFFSSPFPSSDAASTMPQMAFDARAYEMPTSSMTAQSQYQMMTLETEQGPIQLPVDVQAASKVSNKKRKRDAATSQRFRQRRKEKERETFENIAKLEAQVRETAEERDHYLREKDHFRDIALRHRIHITPRPPSPRRRRYATLGGASLAQYQEAEGSERSSTQARRRTSDYVPPQGPPSSTAELPPSMPPFERMSAMPSEFI
jgi:hypothetical protein